MNPEALRRRWDGRARANARFHIRADRTDWTDDAFLASGESDVARLVDPVLDLAPARHAALDLGCGLGRLSRALARRFEQVEAVDISPVMITGARSFTPPPPVNITFSVCPGDGSLPIDTGSIDFAFSYLVFQHLPSAALITAYLRELERVLTPRGLAHVQLNGRHRSLADRCSAGIVRSERVPIVHRKPRVKIDPHDHMGAVLTARGARRIAGRAGLGVVAIEGAGTAELWLTLQAPRR